MQRRAVLSGGAAALLLSCGNAGSRRKIAPDAAFQQAQAGRLLLIDIRTPEEWCSTGIGTPAHPLDMRAADFRTKLLKLAANDKARKIALICATGGRSSALTQSLRVDGFTGVLDVSGGMQGSWLSPGWIAMELPLRKYCTT